MINRIFFITLLLGLSFSVFAQEKMTVEEYRKKVLAYSQLLKQSRENLSSAETDISAARTGFYPKLDASADFNFLINKINFDLGGGNKMSLNQLGYGVSATAAQNVYSGGIVRKQVEALDINRDIAALNVELTYDNICYAADLNYWRLSAMVSFRKAAMQYLDIVSKTYDIVSKRYEDGFISKNDLLMIETRLKTASYELSDMEKQYEDAAISVNVLMGEIPTKDILIADTLLNRNIVLPESRDLDYALNNRPEFAISEKQILASLQMLRITKSDYLPKLAVGVTGQLATPSINITGEPKGTAVAFAQLKVPIFNWNEKRYRLASGNSKVRSSEYERQKTIDDINKDMSVAWSNLVNTYNQIDVVKQSLTIAQESLDLNNYSYDEGVLSILDVLQSQLSWVNAYNNLISTYFSYLQADAGYTKSLGAY